MYIKSRYNRNLELNYKVEIAKGEYLEGKIRNGCIILYTDPKSNSIISLEAIPLRSLANFFKSNGLSDGFYIDIDSFQLKRMEDNISEEFSTYIFNNYYNERKRLNAKEFALALKDINDKANNSNK